MLTFNSVSLHESSVNFWLPVWISYSVTLLAIILTKINNHSIAQITHEFGDY